MNLLEKRKQLHAKLKMASNNVYFNPPANIQLKYPCIIYHLSNTQSLFAENSRYQTQYNYRLTVLDTAADSELVVKLLEIFPTMDIVSQHISDRLYHTYLDYKTF